MRGSCLGLVPHPYGQPIIEYDPARHVTVSGGTVLRWGAKRGVGTDHDILAPPFSGPTYPSLYAPPFTASDADFGGLPSVGGTANAWLRSIGHRNTFRSLQPSTEICVCRFGASSSVQQRIYTGAWYGKEHALGLWTEDPGGSFIYLQHYHGSFWNLKPYTADRSQGLLVIAREDGESTKLHLRYADSTLVTFGPATGYPGTEMLGGLSLFALPDGQEQGGTSKVAYLATYDYYMSDTEVAEKDSEWRTLMGWP